MSEKRYIKPITVFIIVIGFLILLKTQFPLYRVSNSSMQPNYNSGEVILVNKLSNLTSNDACIFSLKDEEHISRVIGLPGQEIVIKNGSAWVDDVCHDGIQTQTAYRIILGDHPPLAENDLLLKLEPLNDYKEYKANLTPSERTELERLDFVKKVTQIIYPNGYDYTFSDYPIFPNKKAFNWSIDNFGPVKVPADCYFVLGDNRHQSIDSRYFGFIKKEDIVGKVAFKFSFSD